MRYILLLALLCSLSIGKVNGQMTYNRWSIEGSFGLSDAMGPFAEGYISNYLTFCHAGLGTRYMFTNKIGLAWDYAFDRVKNDEVGYNGFPAENGGGTSLPFETHYFRTSLHLILDLGRIIEIENLHEDFSILTHFGWGFSTLKDSHHSVWFKNWKTQGSDEMMNLIWGLTPQYRIGNRWSINMDVSFVSNVFQTKTFDFTENNFDKGTRGKIVDFSVGASYYLGKHEKHLDWVALPGGHSTYYGNDTIKKVETIRTIETIKVRGQNPNPNPNPEDQQIKQKIDSTDASMLPDADFDKDGILNKDDHCPTSFGVAPTGCPSADKDGDGVPNEIDKCPELAGIESNNGCPGIDLKTKMILNEAMIKVEFEAKNDILMEESNQYLDKVVVLLNEHPEYDLGIYGHTDSIGEDGPLLSLSKARAKVVMEYLISKGIDASRLSYDGFGRQKPIASNESPAGRNQNERIEFEVLFR